MRRDFISWGATVLAAVSLTQVSFVLQIAEGPPRPSWSWQITSACVRCAMKLREAATGSNHRNVDASRVSVA